MSRVFAETKSVCPYCLQTISANKAVGDDGYIYLEKICPEHGFFRTLIWEGKITDYLMWDTRGDYKTVPKAAMQPKNGCPRDCGLCTAHESDGCCVLLEVTSRCNLHCPVCFASAGEGLVNEPSLDEICAQYDMLIDRGGPFNIQLSGGEPTIRDDIAEIIDEGKKRGFSFFQLNTNGIRIADEEGYAEYLKNAGVSCVFLQFDGLCDSSYEALRGRPLLSTKLKAILNCKKHFLPVVLVPTVCHGINDNELGDIIKFAYENMPHVRGVHFQPMSYFGRCAMEVPVYRLTIPKILRNIEEQTGRLILAEHFTGGGAENAYCSFHASYNISPDGRLIALPSNRNSGCCVKSSEARDFVAKRWSSCDASENIEYETSLDEFLANPYKNIFTVSGMLFQDAYNLDLERLRKCHICEVSLKRGLVPFCAFNLTSADGTTLYRNKE